MLRRVPSTIRIPDVTLAFRPPPTTPSALLFFLPTVSNNGDRSDASRLFSPGRRYGFKRDQNLRVARTWKYVFLPEPIPGIPRFACFRVLAFWLPPASGFIIMHMAATAGFCLRPFFIAPGPSHVGPSPVVPDRRSMRLATFATSTR